MSARLRPDDQPVVPIGAMRDRVTVQRATTAADSIGGQTTTWADLYAGIPAQVRPISGREIESEGRDVSNQQYLITIRHGYTITVEDRIVWGSQTLAVRSVENRDMRARRLTLRCESGLGS